MPPQVRFGDIISNGNDKAMFLAWDEPWTGKLLPARRTQRVLVLSTQGLALRFALPILRTTRVNWLNREGDAFIHPVERR